MSIIFLAGIVLVLLITAQIFLSLRRNETFGLIIPGINIVWLIITSLFFSDMISAGLWLFISAIPILFWLAIYKYCRRIVEQNKIKELNRMRIGDL
jgi:hypothetical protein